MKYKLSAAVMLIITLWFTVACGCTHYVKRIEAHRDISGDVPVYYLEWAWYEVGKLFPGAIPAKRELICTTLVHLAHDATITGICK